MAPRGPARKTSCLPILWGGHLQQRRAHAPTAKQLCTARCPARRWGLPCSRPSSTCCVGATSSAVLSWELTASRGQSGPRQALGIQGLPPAAGGPS